MNFRSIITLTIFLVLSTSLSGQKRYNLKVGDQFKVRATVKQDIEQTMLGQLMTTEQTIVTVDLYEVVEADSKGYLLRTTGLSRSLLTENAQGSVTMDSDLEGDDHLAFRALTNKSYYVRMSPYGKFIGLEGVDKLKDEVRKDLEGTLLENSVDELMSAYNSETLGTAFDGQFYIYPEPGKPWSRSAQMTVNNLPVNTSLDFSRPSRGEIRASGVMAISGEFEVMGQVMSADMSGDQSSVFTLDKKTGLAKTISTIQQMEGSLDVQDISVPMTLKTKVTVEVSW